MAQPRILRKFRDENARALFQRAGNAGVAIAVDTRPKTYRDRTRYKRKSRNVRWSIDAD
jgi:hypothetical protein